MALMTPSLRRRVISVIDLMPGDKAPGPNGFTGNFFKKCWYMIKEGVMCGIDQLSNLHTDNLHMSHSRLFPNLECLKFHRE